MAIASQKLHDLKVTTFIAAAVGTVLYLILLGVGTDGVFILGVVSLLPFLIGAFLLAGLGASIAGHITDDLAANRPTPPVGRVTFGAGTSAPRVAPDQLPTES